MTDSFEPIEPTVRRKRHPIRNTVIVVLVFAIVLVAGYFVASSLAKTFAITAVKTGVAQETGAAPSDVHVSLGTAAILPQFLRRKLDTVRVRIDSFTSGTISGSATFTGTDVPFSTGTPAKDISITVSIADDALLGLVESTSGQANATVKIAGDAITIASTEKVLGHTVPFSVQYSVGANGNNLVLTPQKIVLSGKSYTPAALKKSPYGALVSGLTATRNQCLSAGLPQAMHLTAASVVGNHVLVSATGSGISLQQLATKGTCS